MSNGDSRWHGRLLLVTIFFFVTERHWYKHISLKNAADMSSTSVFYSENYALALDIVWYGDIVSFN